MLKNRNRLIKLDIEDLEVISTTRSMDKKMPAGDKSAGKQTNNKKLKNKKFTSAWGAAEEHRT